MRKIGLFKLQLYLNQYMLKTICKQSTNVSLPANYSNFQLLVWVQLVAIDKIRSDTNGNSNEVAKHPSLYNIHSSIRQSTTIRRDITHSRILEDVLLGWAGRIIRSS